VAGDLALYSGLRVGYSALRLHSTHPRRKGHANASALPQDEEDDFSEGLMRDLPEEPSKEWSRTGPTHSHAGLHRKEHAAGPSQMPSEEPGRKRVHLNPEDRIKRWKINHGPNPGQVFVTWIRDSNGVTVEDFNFCRTFVIDFGLQLL